MQPRRSRAFRVAVRLLATAALALGVLAAALPRPHAAEAAPTAGACPRMTERAEAYEDGGGRAAFVLLDLTDWTRCHYARHEVFRSASLYKLVVLAEAYAQSEAGAFSFEERLPGWTIDAAEMARLMIQLSENDPAEDLHEHLGFEAVNARAARMGMDDTSLSPLAPYVTTADDVAAFFTRLHAGRVVSPEADEAMLETLLGQQRADRIPAGLPEGTEIAHKTGRLDLFSHDAGIVQAPAGPFVLVLLTEDPVAQWWGNELIRDLAAIAWESFAEPRALPLAALAPADPMVHEAAYPRQDAPALLAAAGEPPAAPAPAPAANVAAAEAAPLPVVASVTADEAAPPPVVASVAAAEAASVPVVVSVAADEASVPVVASVAAAEAAPPPVVASVAADEAAPASGAPAFVAAVTAAGGRTSIAAPAPVAASSNGAPANAALPNEAASADAGGGAVAASIGGAAQALGAGVAAAPWRQPAGLTALAAALALAALALLTRRRGPLPAGPDTDPAAGRADSGSSARWRTPPRGARSNVMMRFGSRGNDPAPETPARATEEEAPMEADDAPAAEAVQGAMADAPTSPRLERLAEFFSSEEGLVEEMGRQIASEMAPLRHLLGRQRQAIERVMENLDRQLVPIREYVASEESNIETLRREIGDEGGDYVSRLFADYMEQQHQRIADARQRVDDQRSPFERLAEDEREAVELALSFFDEDIEALEHTLNEQRRIIARLLEAMRSAEFAGVRQLIDDREQVLAAAARDGLTDPVRIAGQMRTLREALNAEDSEHLGRVVGGVAETDERLLRAGTGPGGVHAVPFAAAAGEERSA